MTPFLEMSAKIPLIIVPPLGDNRIFQGVEDDRIAEYGDIMPTILDLAGIPIPDSVDRLSLAGEECRDYLYGEHGENEQAMRMIRKDQYKLLYYPVGNRRQLFDIENDPDECVDLAAHQSHQGTWQELETLLTENLYGEDTGWKKNGLLIGLPEQEYKPPTERALKGQRGFRFM
jgi:arylsulfatase